MRNICNETSKYLNVMWNAFFLKLVSVIVKPIYYWKYLIKGEDLIYGTIKIIFVYYWLHKLKAVIFDGQVQGKCVSKNMAYKTKMEIIFGLFHIQNYEWIFSNLISILLSKNSWSFQTVHYRKFTQISIFLGLTMI